MVSAASAASANSAPLYRSGAVARMVRMPVATLRVWEQRYQVVGPSTSASGHRQYSAQDVERLLLIKSLTDHGHAIGAIANLNTAQLQQVANTHVASTRAATSAQASASASAAPQANHYRRSSEPAPQPLPLQLVVVGPALARRMQRTRVAQQLGRQPRYSAVFESLAMATRAATTANNSAKVAQAVHGRPVDWLLWQANGLHADVLPELQAAAKAWGAQRAAVVYRFANAAALEAFTAAQVLCLREPQDDEALGAWLATLRAHQLAQTAESGQGAATAHMPSLGQPVALFKRLTPEEGALALMTGEPAPRRFDEASVLEFASLSSTIACECPRHIAELLIQLSNFESYSEQCANRDPEDAQLHAYLKRVSGAARALFETALERVAIHEGLALPR